jgi:hypothetical protein
MALIFRLSRSVPGRDRLRSTGGSVLLTDGEKKLSTFPQRLLTSAIFKIKILIE